MSAPVRMSSQQFAALYGGVPGIQTAKEAELKPQIRIPKARKANKTEAAYIEVAKRNHPGCEIRYEPFNLHLPSGCSYCPDVVAFRSDGSIAEIAEVKGPYIHSSRSIHAFKEARVAFPFWPFRFAQLTKAGWAITAV